MGDRLDALGLTGCGLIFASMIVVQLLPLLSAKAHASAIGRRHDAALTRVIAAVKES